MASLPDILVTSFIARQPADGIAIRRRSRLQSEHVDNPTDRVKFRRLDKTAAIASRTKIRRGDKGEFDGGYRGKNLAQNPG
jgi:hypothetical protein